MRLFLCIALIVLLPSVHSIEALCYKLRWRLADPIPPERIIRPVTAFPNNHILTSRAICGQNFKAGDSIPAAGLWSNTGSLSASSCATVSGGSLFYAYNYPSGSSSNTGFETGDKAMFYFVQRADSNVSFVLAHDKKSSGGGTASLNINAPALGGKGVGWELQDDPGDGYQWDESKGEGGLQQAWVDCCTDGAVLGPLPPAGYKITFKYLAYSGMNGVRVGSFDAATNDLSLLTLDLSDLDDGIEFTAFNCDQICETRTSCGECASEDRCAWCGDKCVFEDTTDLLEGCSRETWTSDNACCDVCSVANSCDECAQRAGCAWDFELSTCVSGLFTDPTNEFFCQVGLKDWRYKALTPRCTYPPGAISNEGRLTNPRTTPVDQFCSGRGTPDFDLNTCVCDYGYHGLDCRFECPGGASNPCNLQGQCTVGGYCVCESTRTGPACELVKSDTGCILSNSDSCGVLLTDGPFTGYCSGSETRGPTCSCLEGFWGPNCTYPCPGMEASGAGSICGGYGSCNPGTGQCQCEPCYEVDPLQGVCVQQPCGPCANGGACVCDRSTDTYACSCRGAYTGDDCTSCACYNAGTCNSISGECVCPTPFGSDLCELDCTDAVPGSLLGCVAINLCKTNSGNCGQNTTCIYESSMERRCDCLSDYIPVGDLDAGAPCAVVDRCLDQPPVCGFNSACTFISSKSYNCTCDPGTYSLTSQINCSVFSPPCNATLNETETVNATATSDRECRVPTTPAPQTPPPTTNVVETTEKANLEAASASDATQFGMPTFALGILAAGVGLAILLGIIITARRREGAKKAPPAHNFKGRQDRPSSFRLDVTDLDSIGNTSTFPALPMTSLREEEDEDEHDLTITTNAMAMFDVPDLDDSAVTEQSTMLSTHSIRSSKASRRGSEVLYEDAQTTGAYESAEDAEELDAIARP